MNLHPVNLHEKIFKFYLKNIPNHPYKIRIEKKLANLLSNKINLKEDEENIKFKLDINDFITQWIIKQGTYEIKSLNLCKNILKGDPGFFIDVGANFGLYTCLLSPYYSHCISIDASPNAFLKLCNHIKLNEIEDKVTPVHCAVSSSVDIVGMGLSQFNNLGTNRISNTPSYYTGSMPTQYILEKFVYDKKITLMKIDIEGHELQCLESIDLKSMYSPKNFLIEYQPINNTNTTNILEHLRKNGYTIYNIDNEPIDIINDNIKEDNIFARR